MADTFFLLLVAASASSLMLVYLIQWLDGAGRISSDLLTAYRWLWRVIVATGSMAMLTAGVVEHRVADVYAEELAEIRRVPIEAVLIAEKPQDCPPPGTMHVTRTPDGKTEIEYALRQPTKTIVWKQ